MRIQLADTAHWPALKSIYRDVRRRQFHWVRPDRIGDDDLARDAEGEALHVATEGEIVLGFVSVWVPDRFVHHLFVHLDHQGRGVGGRLLAFARETYPPTLRLKCVAANRRALDFYLARGWRALATDRDENGDYLLLESAPGKLASGAPASPN